MATKQILYLAYFPLIGKRTRDANFFDTAQALEDRRAVVIYHQCCNLVEEWQGHIHKYDNLYHFKYYLT